MAATVWILWHTPHPGAADNGDEMLIGAYSSQETALAAVDRLSGRPGFQDHPRVVDDSDRPGFYMEPYTLDEDNWREGYVRV